MGFVQVIDFHTSDIDALEKSGDDWEAASEGKRTVRKQILTRDRNDPSRYLLFVFFDSFEAAKQNSQLPETQAAAERFASLCSDVAFLDLDIVGERG